jgi:hypothetical protein
MISDDWVDLHLTSTHDDLHAALKAEGQFIEIAPQAHPTRDLIVANLVYRIAWDDVYKWHLTFVLRKREQENLDTTPITSSNT